MQAFAPSLALAPPRQRLQPYSELGACPAEFIRFFYHGPCPPSCPICAFFVSWLARHADEARFFLRTARENFSHLGGDRAASGWRAAPAVLVQELELAAALPLRAPLLPARQRYASELSSLHQGVIVMEACPFCGKECSGLRGLKLHVGTWCLSNPDSRESQKRGQRSAPAPAAERDDHGMEIQFLGTASAKPSTLRNVSATIVKRGDKAWLFDCGEATTMQFLRFRGNLHMKQVERVFITHMHGDHVFGLPGLLVHISSLQEAGAAPGARPVVHVYGPPGLRSFLRVAFATSRAALRIRLAIHELAPRNMPNWGAVVYEDSLDPACPAEDASLCCDFDCDDGLTWKIVEDAEWEVLAAPLRHRKIRCCGFVLKEKTGRPDHKGRKIVVLGDTQDSAAMVPIAMDADLLVHEATFTDDMREMAVEYGHSTAGMAGAFAARIRAKALVLTHFSTRFENVASLKRAEPGAAEREPAPEAAAAPMTDEERAALEERRMQEAREAKEEMRILVQQAQHTFRSLNVVAARDFLTVPVPPAGSRLPLAPVFQGPVRRPRPPGGPSMRTPAPA